MKEACSSCGHTVDPKCETCNGLGEIWLGEPGPVADIITANENETFQRQVIAAALDLKPAIDLIGCALVAFKASRSRNRSPLVLLGKRAKEEGRDLWVLPGGKQEFTETPEQCVRREFKEEVGVTNLVSLIPIWFTYNNTQPDRKFLMLYYAAYISAQETLRLDTAEFSALDWFDVDLLPADMWQSDRDAIAHTLLKRPL